MLEQRSQEPAVRDRVYLAGYLLLAGILLFLGRDFLQSSVVITWGLAFGGTTAAGVLFVLSNRLRLQLQASRHELARKEAELSFALEVQKALFPRRLRPGSRDQRRLLRRNPAPGRPPGIRHCRCQRQGSAGGNPDGQPSSDAAHFF